MVDPVVCSQCGARNPTEADWCGQCFAPLGDHPTIESDSTSWNDVVDESSDEHDVMVVDVPTPVDEGGESDIPKDTETGVWVCTVCETANPLEEPQCSACGTSIFTSFGAAEEEPIEVDPQRVLLRSVLLPGLGHAYVGQGLLGSAIGGLTVMALGFGIALAASGVGRFGWPLVFLAFAVWATAALDSLRIASGDADAILLRPRVITALVGLVVVVVVMAALSVQGRT